MWSIEEGPRLDRGSLNLEFSVGPQGNTYISKQLATYPFHVCRAHYHDPQFPALATLYTQSCSGGIFAGNRLDTVVHLRDSAAVHLTTQASTIVHTMIDDSATVSTSIICQAGSVLEYVPDPLILFSGARLRSTLTAALHPSSVAVIADSFLCHDPHRKGRVDFAYESDLTITDLDGRPLALDTMRVTDDLMAAGLVGVMGHFKAYGSMVLLLPNKTHDGMVTRTRKTALGLADAELGISTLPGDRGLSIRIVATDGASLRKATTAVWCEARSAYAGHKPQPRRK